MDDGFTKVPNALISSNLSSDEKVILMSLCMFDHQMKDGKYKGYVFPRQRQLVDITGIPRMKLIGILKSLDSRGIISMERNPGYSSKYFLNFRSKTILLNTCAVVSPSDTGGVVSPSDTTHKEKHNITKTKSLKIKRHSADGVVGVLDCGVLDRTTEEPFEKVSPDPSKTLPNSNRVDILNSTQSSDKDSELSDGVEIMSEREMLGEGMNITTPNHAFVLDVDMELNSGIKNGTCIKEARAKTRSVGSIGSNKSITPKIKPNTAIKTSNISHNTQGSKKSTSTPRNASNENTVKTWRKVVNGYLKMVFDVSFNKSILDELGDKYDWDDDHIRKLIMYYGDSMSDFMANKDKTYRDKVNLIIGCLRKQWGYVEAQMWWKDHEFEVRVRSRQKQMFSSMYRSELLDPSECCVGPYRYELSGKWYVDCEIRSVRNHSVVIYAPDIEKEIVIPSNKFDIDRIVSKEEPGLFS